ncbi:nuclear transport factor 2 family protein [Gordonia sp. (in: high G+C Gram-positive bacteria)]|uniref:nuclear transport factor 2 family protein n=1 Tax=Gordonia sp. (in: high G+C Gram-positive bacteria) TaxID=84139 RepID=UPI003F98C8D9
MTESSRPAAVARWHELVARPDRNGLTRLIAPGAVFRSPAVHAPQEGADKTLAYLWAALTVLGPSLAYGQEWISDSSAVLSFTATVDDLTLEGVDIIRWDDEGRIVEFTVMVRPYRGLLALIAAMGAALTEEAR